MKTNRRRHYENKLVRKRRQLNVYFVAYHLSHLHRDRFVEMLVKEQLKTWRNTIIVISTPILLLPLLICFHSDASRCGYVILLLVIYWITEAIPQLVTSLLPLILFPIAGVLKANQVAPNYFRASYFSTLDGTYVQF